MAQPMTIHKREPNRIPPHPGMCGVQPTTTNPNNSDKINKSRGTRTTWSPQVLCASLQALNAMAALTAVS